MKQKIFILLTFCTMLILFTNANLIDNVETTEVGYSSASSMKAINKNVKSKTSSSGAVIVQPDVAGVTTVMALLPHRTYKTQFEIKHSNVVLDCNHAVLDGASSPEGSAAITITGELAPTNKRQIKNIVIKNCIIRNYEFGVKIVNAFRGTGVSNPFDAQIPNWFEYINTAPERIYERDQFREGSPVNVTLSNNRFENIKAHGVNIGPYVTKVLIEKSSFIDNETGIHLSQGSQNNRILKSVFVRNGLRYQSKSTSYREAIVIDASRYNTISKNIFQNNYGKAIALYKNCGEAAPNNKNVLDKAGKTREESADGNNISFNHFYLSHSFYEKHKNKNFKAIEIASRQDKNTLVLMCSDGYYYVDNKITQETIYSSDLERIIIRDANGKFNISQLLEVQGHKKDNVRAFARDYSKENKIFNNTFVNFNKTVITVMDDNNTLKSNLFKNNVPGVIQIGSVVRGMVNDPVRGVTSVNNCAGSKGKSAQLSLIGGSTKANNNIPNDVCSHRDFKLVKTDKSITSNQHLYNN